MAVTVPNVFVANTLIKSADVNADFTTLGNAMPWTANPIAAKGDLIVGTSASVSTTLGVGAPNQVLKVIDGTPAWATFSNNGINYISSNPDAETDISGWATYADVAGVAPVDGTGGSPAITFARSTSTPLRGVGSFLLTQPNSTNVQGNGVSFDFTIDSADKAKSLVISFDYNASSDFTPSSGETGSESDIEVYIYDVTNTILIPVSPKVLTSNGANNFKFSGEFQTAADSDSYRLCLHCATTSAPSTGYQLKFDNVFVGPQANVAGAPVTDWQSYTPIFTGLGTAANIEFEWRRIGDSAHIRGKFDTGTCTGVEARITFPAGLVSADTTKIPSRKLAGQLTKARDSDVYNGVPVLIEPSVSYMTFGGVYSGGTSSGLSTLTPQNGNGIFQDVETQALFMEVPIQGWASTLSLSQDTDTRVVAANYRGQPTGTLTTSYNVSTFPTKVADTHASYSAGTYTVPVSGLYNIAAQVRVDGTYSLNGYLQVAAFVNAVEKQVGTLIAGGSLTTGIASLSLAGLPLTAGDLVTIQVQTDASGPTYFSGAEDSFLSINRLSGPATIAAADSVMIRYHDSTSTINNGSPDPVAYDVKDYDTHGAYSGSTFTAPSSGKYSVTAAVSVVGSFSTPATDNAVFALFKNGSLWSELFTYNIGNGIVMQFTDIVPCIAGDTLQIKLQCSLSGSSIQNSGRTYLCISRIGN